ncbi:hypothetical protein [uncultured Mediterranean phage]|nr:hypothetical protein [uncultured Mediterranean phage]
MPTSFENILFEIYARRKAYFDRNLKKFLTPPSSCAAKIVFVEEDDEFTTLLDHFDSILKLK